MGGLATITGGSGGIGGRVLWGSHLGTWHLEVYQDGGVRAVVVGGAVDVGVKSEAQIVAGAVRRQAQGQPGVEVAAVGVQLAKGAFVG